MTIDRVEFTSDEQYVHWNDKHTEQFTSFRADAAPDTGKNNGPWVSVTLDEIRTYESGRVQGREVSVTISGANKIKRLRDMLDAALKGEPK